MYIVTRKRGALSVHPTLAEAVEAAVRVPEPPCWVWQLAVSRLGTLKRIEVPREAIGQLQVEGIGCIQNRFERDVAEPVDGQLYLTQDDGQAAVSVYRRETPPDPKTAYLGRYVREAQEKAKMVTPQAVAQYLQAHIYTPFASCEQEEFWVLLLDARYQVTYEMMAYRGTVEECHIRPAEVMREAVRLNMPKMMVAHNHPTGQPEPSQADLLLTGKLKEAAELLGIDLCDHLIVGDNAWVSLQERGFIHFG